MTLIGLWRRSSLAANPGKELSVDKVDRLPLEIESHTSNDQKVI